MWKITIVENLVIEEADITEMMNAMKKAMIGERVMALARMTIVMIGTEMMARALEKLAIIQPMMATLIAKTVDPEAGGQALVLDLCVQLH
jgi:hypothetical protein